MATAKQIAWRKKFAALARAGTLRKSGSTRARKASTTKKVKSKRSHSGGVGKKKGGGKRKGFGGIAGGFGKAVRGLGYGALAGTLAALFAPQFEPIAKIGGAAYGGGLQGALAQIAVDVMRGGGLNLGGILGGLGGGGGGNGEAV